MSSQARATATRLSIIDAAVELFTEHGFGGTNLNQIIRKAHVSSGAFYYHFASKDEVAFAIIDQAALGMADWRTAFLNIPDSGLEDVIAMTFRLSRMLSHDRSYWVAAYLEQTMARYSSRGMDDVAGRVRGFLLDISRAMRPSELREGITPEQRCPSSTAAWL